MAVTINTYTWLLSGVLARLARQGDVILTPEFDNFLANCEQRMYYGYATEDMANPLRSDPLRIVEMETAVESAGVKEGDDALAQPSDFLELISVYNTTLGMPMHIVAQRVIDGYGTLSVGGTKLIAVSGESFRILDAAPTDLKLAMRYYQKLTTPTAAEANDILTKYPNVYLYGCLTEAAIFTQDEPSALRYLQLYNASVAGLNARTQRITASADPRLRVRAWMP